MRKRRNEKCRVMYCIAVAASLIFAAAAGAEMTRADADRHEAEGFDHLKKGRFEKALESYENARAIYVRRGLPVERRTMKGVMDEVKKCIKTGVITQKIAGAVFNPNRLRSKGGDLSAKGSEELLAGDYFKRGFDNTLPIFFVVGTSNFLNSNQARKQIRIYADEIRENTAGFDILGFASDEGSEYTNRRLSEERAETVRDILVRRHHISSDRIRWKGYGENPLFFATPVRGLNGAALERAREDNRRVEVKQLLR